MKNFLLKALYGALGTVLVSLGSLFTGASQADASSIATTAALIGVATGGVAAVKRIVVGKPKT